MDQITDLDRNRSVSPDAITSLIQRIEGEILHADILHDMRRLEYENFVKRYQRKRAMQCSKERLQALHVPYSQRFHRYIAQKRDQAPLTPFFDKTKLESSSLSNRQKLVQWAYNNPNTWAKTYMTSRGSASLPEHCVLKQSFLTKHENELCMCIV